MISRHWGDFLENCQYPNEFLLTRNSPSFWRLKFHDGCSTIFFTVLLNVERQKFENPDILSFNLQWNNGERIVQRVSSCRCKEKISIFKTMPKSVTRRIFSVSTRVWILTVFEKNMSSWFSIRYKMIQHLEIIILFKCYSAWNFIDYISLVCDFV